MLSTNLIKRVKIYKWLFQKSKRDISALYITGDKAKEQYVTLKPFMDFTELQDSEKKLLLEASILHRKQNNNLKEIIHKYEMYNDILNKLEQIEKQKEVITKKLKNLLMDKSAEDECNILKEQGKLMREQIKSLKAKLYPIDDEFVHAFLNLPNTLHHSCPKENSKLLFKFSSKTKTQKTSNVSKLVQIIDKNRYYFFDETATFDLESIQVLQQHFVVKGDYMSIANPDFVRCVLLEANATPLENYHLVLEEHLQNKINPSYLVGAGGFESFLGALTKLCVYPSVLPLKWVSCGRNYQQVQCSTSQAADLYNVTQTNAVQTLVATPTATAAEQEMEQLLNITIDFYKDLELPILVNYIPANKLMQSECLRASIEVYSPYQKQHICVGYVSNFSDFVSKRLLFSIREKKNYHFLHLIGGPVFFASRVIAALLEYELPLKKFNYVFESNVTPKETVLHATK